MSDRPDRGIRILLAILFFPIGLILALAGVRTRIIAWSFAGFYVWLLTVIIIVGVIGDSGESIPSDPIATDPVQAAQIPAPTMIPQSRYQVENTDIRCGNRNTMEKLHKAAEDQEWEQYDQLLSSPDCKRIFQRTIVEGPAIIEEIGEGSFRTTYGLYSLDNGSQFWISLHGVALIKPSQPPHEFSVHSMNLLSMYRELEQFRHEPDFHFYCYGTGGPYNIWAENVLGLHGQPELTSTVVDDTGIFAYDLWSLGWEYCQNQGRETTDSQEIKNRMLPDWLNAEPKPTSSPNPTPVPTATSIPAPPQVAVQDVLPIPTAYPTPVMVATAFAFPTLTPTPTSAPTLIPTPTSIPIPLPPPTPTPDGPLMAQEECRQVVNDYMGSIIESAIVEGTEDPMDFRYWTKGLSKGNKLGYNLQYQEYSGFGEKPTHHRVFGNFLVHWWNNEIDLYMLEFFPHPVTCLPRRDVESYSTSFYTYEHEYVGFGRYGHVGDTEDPMIYLRELGEPAGVVEGK